MHSFSSHDTGLAKVVIQKTDESAGTVADQVQIQSEAFKRDQAPLCLAALWLNEAFAE